MDLGTIIGLVTVIAVIVITIVEGGNVLVFWDIPAIMLVVIGGISTVLIAFPLSDVLSIIGITKNAFMKRKQDSMELISYLVDLSNRARREGILSLQEPLKKSDDAFIKSGFQLVIDGQDPEVTENVLNIEIDNIELRHKIGADIYTFYGAIAPGIAMVGTLIGLVQMLASMNDPSSIGPAMSLALVCTFYGATVANGICIPMAKKLTNKSAEEMLVKGLIKEAILAIQAGDNPRIVEQKLLSFLAPKHRISTFDKK